MNDIDVTFGQIQNLINQNKKIQNTKKWISAIGSMIILITFCSYAYIGFTLFKSFNIDTVVQQVIDDSTVTILPEFKKLGQAMVEEVIPQFSEELLKQFEIETHQLEKKAIQISKNLESYMGNDIKLKTLKRLENAFARTLTRTEDLFPSLKNDDLLKAMDEIQLVFLDGIQNTIDQNISIVTDSVFNLNSSIQKLGNAQEIQHMNESWIPEVKARLFESFLEVMIFHINPKAGAELVVKGETK